MNLRSRLLMIGCFVLLVQMIALVSLYYFSIQPEIFTLEKKSVEKDLHRSLENFQRQLYVLEQITQLLTWQPSISSLANSQTIPQNIAKEPLLEKMVQYELNLMYILNTDKKVIWEEIIDLSNEQSYPHQGFLTSLWENYPGFLEHPNMMSLQAGIYNSSLGPMFIVSTPIADDKHPQVVKGILIVGRLITPEMVQFLNNLTFTNIRVWPLEGASLSNKHLNIIERTQQDPDKYIIERNENLMHGYMSLPDLSSKPNLLISVAKPRVLKNFSNEMLLKCAAIFVLAQLLFLILLFYLIRHALVEPVGQLIERMHNTDKKWVPPNLSVSPSSDMGQLTSAITHFMVRQQNQLAHDTTMAYRDGMHQARQDLYHEFEETLLPLIHGLEWIEKKLTNLPTNDIERIVAESKTGQITKEQWTHYAEKLQALNDRLRHQQKEMRQQLFELHTKALRNAAILRVISRSLDPARQISTFATERKEKLTKTR
ncbi:MAG: CHASE4 domain-containing protein [Candidatus Berkiella sp.]